MVFTVCAANPATRSGYWRSVCKRRGICPSCGARRMAESAALLVDDGLSLSAGASMGAEFFRIHCVSCSPAVRSIMGKVLGIVYRVIATHLIKKAGFRKKAAHTGAVTLIQCFGSSLNLNILCGAPHKIFHVKFCVMWSDTYPPPWFPH